MSVDRPVGSSSQAPLRTPCQKIHHLCYYGFFLLFICLMLFLFMLCTYVLFFSKPFPMKTLQIQGLILFGFYNPDKLHAFHNIKSETHQFILDDGISPKV